MKKIFGFLICALIASTAVAGEKTVWQVDVLQGQQSVGSLSYIASSLTDGTFLDLSPSLLMLAPATSTAPNIHGHLMLSLKAAQTGSAKVKLEIWDSSGLDQNSPYYKSYFATVESLTPNQTATVDFTQGDASVKDGSVTYTLNLKLVSVSLCQDGKDCAGQSIK